MPLGWLVDDLSFLPIWVRPWLVFLLVVAVGWFLLFRSGAKWLVVWTLRLGLLAGLALLTVPLAVEYVGTRRRRVVGRQPGRIGTGVSEVADALALNLAGVDRRLAQCQYRVRTWPRKTMGLLAVGAVLSWIVFAASPAWAAPTTTPGKAYGAWQDFERWAGGGGGRVAVPVGEAAPVLVMGKTAVALSTSSAHAGQIARLIPVGQEKKAIQLLLDAKGNGAVRLTRSNSASFVRGAVYLVEVKDLRVPVRLL